MFSVPVSEVVHQRCLRDVCLWSVDEHPVIIVRRYLRILSDGTPVFFAHLQKMFSSRSPT